ncbi:hypothetical protein MMPV_000648 [Pyropia vietnamensis]
MVSLAFCAASLLHGVAAPRRADVAVAGWPLAVTPPVGSRGCSWAGAAPSVGAATAAAAAAAAAAGDLMRLQNGSDVRGVALPLIPAEPVTLTPAAAAELGAAFAAWVSSSTGVPVADVTVTIGRDSRLSGPELAEATAAGVLAAGARVIDVGLSTTPAMFMSTVLPFGGRSAPATAGVMLTASHLPPNRNGLKFFTAKGGTSKADVAAIIDAAATARDARGEPPAVTVDAPLPTHPFLDDYGVHLAGLIRDACGAGDTPLDGFHIVVDAGNGAGGFFAGVLESLGANTDGSQFLDPDGTFPNHVPNPEDADAMAALVSATTAAAADLGVIFDTDVDRSGVCDRSGGAVNRNRLIAMVARIALRESPGGVIVTDSVTSNGLARFIEGLGGKHLRYRKGYKNIIDKGIEVDAPLAIETSGHGAMRENYMLDDGCYLAVKIIVEMVRLRAAGEERGIAALLDGLSEPLASHEFRLPFIDTTDFGSQGLALLDAFPSFVADTPGWTVDEPNYEGVRVSVDEGNGCAGWLLLRQSLHDPLLPLNIETETPGGVVATLRILRDGFLSKFPNIDTSSLDDYEAAAPDRAVTPSTAAGA